VRCGTVARNACFVSTRQHSSTYVSMRQSIRQHTLLRVLQVRCEREKLRCQCLYFSTSKASKLSTEIFNPQKRLHMQHKRREQPPRCMRRLCHRRRGRRTRGKLQSEGRREHLQLIRRQQRAICSTAESVFVPLYVAAQVLLY
jgi:hypothetical protein